MTFLNNVLRRAFVYDSQSCRLLKYKFLCNLMIVCIAAGAWAKPATTQPKTSEGAKDTPQGWFAPIKPTLEKPSLPKEITQAIVVPIREPISQKTYKAIRRKILRAARENSQMVIFDMDTFGGDALAALEITRFIKTELNDIYTVCYVRTRAISAGAAIAMSCDEIVMTPIGKLGDCAPISPGGKIEGVRREKIETVLRSEFEESAQTNGYNVPLSVSMVSCHVEVWLVRNIKTRELRYVRKSKFEDKVIDEAEDEDFNKKREWEKLEVVVPEGTLLTMTTKNAEEYGFVKFVAKAGTTDPYAALEKRYNIVSPPQVFEDNWSENLVDFLTSPAVMGILVFLMLFFGYIEMHTPGFGVFGGIAIACLLVLVSSQYMTGLAMWWEIILLGVGVVLLLLEIFVIPGFGVAGISGLLCMIVAGIAMLVPNLPGEAPIPSSEMAWNFLADSLFAMGVGFVGFMVTAMILSKYLPQSKLLAKCKIVLSNPPRPEKVAATEDAPIYSVKPGDTGVAITMLRPVGEARIGDTLVDVISEGPVIEKGAAVKVLRCDGNRIIVTSEEEK